jgi:hypothetical protein
MQNMQPPPENRNMASEQACFLWPSEKTGWLACQFRKCLDLLHKLRRGAAAIFSTRTRSGARIGDASRCSCAREACTLLLQLQRRPAMSAVAVAGLVGSPTEVLFRCTKNSKLYKILHYIESCGTYIEY